jgi:broad specificity phosphatase PhoE
LSELGIPLSKNLNLELVLASKVARRLAKEAKPVAVYSSDLKRSAETAQTIATACNVSNLVLSPALRERHMGDLHGLKFDDAVRSKPDAYKAFSSEDRSQEIPVTFILNFLTNFLGLIMIGLTLVDVFRTIFCFDRVAGRALTNYLSGVFRT